MKAYPDNIKEISFLADARPHRRPTRRGSRRSARSATGASASSAPAARVCRRRADPGRASRSSTRADVARRHQYRDAYLVDNDSRFVFSFVRSAIEAGAAVANYVELVSAERVGGRWVCRLRDTDSGEEFTTSARVIVNAAGPFVDELNTSLGPDAPITASSTPRASTWSCPGSPPTEHDRVLAFFDDTQRLFYVIPMGHRSVIGTTDTRIDDAVHPRRPTRTATFLLDQINARLDLPPAADRGRRHRRALRRAPARGEGRAAATSKDVDWTSLSRKHEIEARHGARASSPSSAASSPTASTWARRSPRAVEALGIPLEQDLRNWYGEPAAATRKRVLPPGPPDAPRRAAHPPRRRAAHRPAVAAVRPPRLRPCSR